MILSSVETLFPRQTPERATVLTVISLSPATAGLGPYDLQFLGFRCAPPQALRCRPLPRAGTRYPPLEVFSQVNLDFLN
jgi:hypothetical protein